MGLTVKQIRLYSKGGLYTRHGGTTHGEPPPPFEPIEITTNTGLTLMTETGEVLLTG